MIRNRPESILIEGLHLSEIAGFTLPAFLPKEKRPDAPQRHELLLHGEGFEQSYG